MRGTAAGTASAFRGQAPASRYPFASSAEPSGAQAFRATIVIATVATLYRCNTPTDWLCPCGKVARALRRDAVAFESVVVPQRRSLRPEVEALSGQQRVPMVVIEGEVICDSRRIVEHLEFRRGTAPAAEQPQH